MVGLYYDQMFRKVDFPIIIITYTKETLLS